MRLPFSPFRSLFLVVLLGTSLSRTPWANAETRASSPADPGAQRPASMATSGATGSGGTMPEDLVRMTKAGEDAFKVGHFEEACAHFQRAWDARRTHDVAANLGSAELALGRYRDAAEHLAYALRLFPALGSPEAARRLRVNLADARSHVGSIHIRSGGPVGQVKVDARVVAQLPLLDDLFVEPGPHQIELSAVGYETQSRKLVIAKGETNEMEVAWKHAAGSDPSESSKSATASPNPARSASHGSDGPAMGERDRANYTPAYLTAGLGLLAAGAGAVLWVFGDRAERDATTQRDEIRRESLAGQVCHAPDSSVRGPCANLTSSLDDRNRLRNFAVGTFVGAGVALGAALYLAIDPPRSRVAISPLVTQHMAGLAVGGAW